MNTLEAMNEVFGSLRNGNIAGAQAAVVAIEGEASVLPSSVFEHVLRAAIAADALLPFYAAFCQRAFGREAYADMVAEERAKKAVRTVDRIALRVLLQHTLASMKEGR